MILGIPGESRIASPEKAVEGATMVKGLMLCDKIFHLESFWYLHAAD